MLMDPLQQLADDPLGIEQVDRMCDVHDLPGTVFAASCRSNRQHIRVLPDHPGRNGIGRRSDNDMDVGLVHSVQYTVHG
ncbi:hypothetical protein D3C80_1736710 [compost metagenome]